MVVIPASSDWVTTILEGHFQVSTTTTSGTIGEVVLIRGRRCSILWLPIGIFYGAECGCKYTSNFLLPI
jgi:hypothetical protein